MVSAWPEPPFGRPAEPSAGASSERKHRTGVRSITIGRQWPMRSARRWHTIRPEISTDDNILHSLRSLHSLFHSLGSLRSLFHSLLHTLHSLLHRSKVDSPHNILHRNMDILHSKHVCRLDDRPGERADGRVHNTVH